MPILALLHSHPKEGFKRNDLVVRSEDVNLESRPHQAMKVKRNVWKTEDHYVNPGPIQFYHEEKEVTSITDSTKLLFEQADNITREISGLCASIQNDCLFTEKRHLLHATLSSLKSAKEVINALAKTTGDDFENV